MGAWWRMQCEDAHLWEIFLEGDAEPNEEQLTCQEDHQPAVTATRLPLADQATITFIPATWELEGSKGHSDQYFVAMHSSKNAEQSHRLTHPVTWEEAIKFASLLKGIPWGQATRRWERLSPDRKK
ncbi:hypothetical protein TPA0909_11830 [Streptomyces albus]|nr:hypothetical protein TPA0909_11800 [Streptomyces albus]GHJ19569.1 hypothetical protein TPA0909_11830 [Streptomyces albus]